MTFKLKYLPLLMLCFILKQDLDAQIVPPPATQAEVDAGANRFKYVTPFTFANSGLISGPTNGVTATTATNIAEVAASSKQHGSSTLTNLSGTRAITNGSATSFRISSDRIESIGVLPRMAGVEFYDSFEREGITNYPGVSDSGHIWQHAAIGKTTNLVYINEGEFKQTTNGVSGASYWGVTRTNLNVNWTWFGGTVKYRGTGANGFEDTSTIILSRYLDFNTSQPYLHFRLGRSWLQVQLSQTNTILNENFKIPLTNNVFYTFNCYVLNNRLVAEVGNEKFEVVNDSLAQESITNATALIYEHNRRTTNITSGWYVSYGDAWAGAMPFHMQRYMSDGIYRGSNGVILNTQFSDGTVQSTAASNSVMVAAGTGGITVTPSGSGGVMTFTISDDDAGSGGGGGTNFPNVNLLLGGTNLTLSAGVRKAYHNQTNGSHGINLNLAVPESGYEVVYSVSNSGSSDITVTFYTNSVAANPYDIASKTNVNTFTAAASGITKVRLTYTASGLWLLDQVAGPVAIQKFGPGIITDTNGVNGLDITLSTKRLTNYAHAATITINGATDVDMTVTNDLAAGATYTIATPTIGSSGVVRFRPDGSARTVAFQTWPAAIVPLSTNRFSNVTNIDLAASKWAYWNYDIARGTNGTTNCFVWVIQAP